MSGISWLSKGILSIITGPMFSGKTEELIRRVNVLRRANKKVLVFKPILEKRYSDKNLIISHNKNKLNAFLINDEKDFEKILKLNSPFDAIAFDETQFFSIIFFPIIKKLLKKDKIIICAGLDKNYFNQHSSLFAYLLVISDIVDKYFSVCVKCNKIATNTQRILNSEVVDYNEPKILIGGSDNYEPRCKKCFIEFENKKHE